jgi:hypothetical protein
VYAKQYSDGKIIRARDSAIRRSLRKQIGIYFFRHFQLKT